MDKKELQKKIKAREEELETILSDINGERKKNYPLGELYKALNDIREKIRVLKTLLKTFDHNDSNNTDKANSIAKTLTKQGTINIRPLKTRDYYPPPTRKNSTDEKLRIISPFKKLN